MLLVAPSSTAVASSLATTSPASRCPILPPPSLLLPATQSRALQANYAIDGAIARKGQPPAGAAGCGQPVGATASDEPAMDGRQRPACKRLPTAHPQGGGCQRPTRKGLPLAGSAASIAGVAAPWQGDCRLQRTAPSSAQGQWRQRCRRVKERVRAFL
ncbi:hypothetical protein BHE74_00052273 [Ensete ventricosum]|nr:hypothetical protein BHE74_00052273 [Ensete ventricosum]